MGVLGKNRSKVGSGDEECWWVRGCEGVCVVYIVYRIKLSGLGRFC